MAAFSYTSLVSNYLDWIINWVTDLLLICEADMSHFSQKLAKWMLDDF